MPASRFLQLPTELRDLIYEYALVADSVIDLGNLRPQAAYWPSRQALGLCPQLLRVSKRVFTEAIAILYGLNTFSIEAFTFWSGSSGSGHSKLYQQGECVNRVCLLCTPVYDLRPARINLRPKQLLPDPRNLASVPVWNANATRVRRLYTALHPHTYQQYRSHIRWELGGHFRRRAPVEVCRHSIQNALSGPWSLDLLILHVSLPSLAAAEDDAEGGYAFLFPQDSNMWLARAKRDLDQELDLLCNHIATLTKTVVIPHSTRTASRDLAERLRRSCSQNGLAEPGIKSSIPSHLRKTGHLARLKQKPHSLSSELPVYISTYDLSTAHTVVGAAERLGYPLFTDGVESLIHDSIV